MFVKDKSMKKELLNDYLAYKEFDSHIEGLITPDKKDLFISSGLTPVEPDLEQIMVYIERSKSQNESFNL